MNNVFKSSVDKNIMLTQYNHSDIIGNPHKQYISKDRKNADIIVRSLTTPYCYRIYSITLKKNNTWHGRAELEFNIYFRNSNYNICGYEKAIAQLSKEQPYNSTFFKQSFQNASDLAMTYKMTSDGVQFDFYLLHDEIEREYFIDVTPTFSQKALPLNTYYSIKKYTYHDAPIAENTLTFFRKCNSFATNNLVISASATSTGKYFKLFDVTALRNVSDDVYYVNACNLRLSVAQSYDHENYGDQRTMYDLSIIYGKNKTPKIIAEKICNDYYMLWGNSDYSVEFPYRAFYSNDGVLSVYAYAYPTNMSCTAEITVIANSYNGCFLPSQKEVSFIDGNKPEGTEITFTVKN